MTPQEAARSTADELREALAAMLADREGRVEDIFGLWVQGKRTPEWVADRLVKEGHAAAIAGLLARSESAPDPGLLREAARVVESLLIAPHYLGPSEFQEHRKGWNAAVRAALSATPEQAGSGLAELLDELSEAWTSVERAIWPEGPAHGTGSGAYARLKARIIAALAAAPVAEPLDVERLRRALDLCGIGLAEGGRPASEWADSLAAEYARLATGDGDG